MVAVKRRQKMPRGKGTYGSKVGRPAKKKKMGMGMKNGMKKRKK
tara:strand:+ start:207 stop:338 length:132 start_codon:yes stop_codon:yes gene_type:complete